MKKNLPMPMIAGAVLVVLLLLAGGVFAFSKMSAKKTQDQASASAKPKKKRNDPINVIAVSDRPYMTITPGGKNVIVAVEEVKKQATDVDYELEYQSGELLEGAFGALQLQGGKASKEILLGSCSAGGACTYHKDVRGGTLLGRFAGPENYAVKSDWNYIENKAKNTLFKSRDEKFKLTSKDLGKQSVVIVYNSPGYPKTPEGTVISDVYSVTTASGVTGTGSVSISLNEDAANATIMGWDGSSWQAMSTKVSNKTATADGNLFNVYLVTKK
jgi:hypothetical protein